VKYVDPDGQFYQYIPYLYNEFMIAAPKIWNGIQYYSGEIALGASEAWAIAGDKFTNLFQAVTKGAETGNKGAQAKNSGSSSGNSSNNNNSNNNQDPNKIKNTYNSIKNSPKYPEGFKAVQDGTQKYNVKNGELLDKLREIDSGKWMKVYKDGYNAAGDKVSIHYFESSSGQVFDVAVKSGWSNF
jgi:hypothetical protein